MNRDEDAVWEGLKQLFPFWEVESVDYDSVGRSMRLAMSCDVEALWSRVRGPGEAISLLGEDIEAARRALRRKGAGPRFRPGRIQVKLWPPTAERASIARSQGDSPVVYFAAGRLR